MADDVSLRVIAVEKYYARFHALRDANLKVGNGEFLTLLGPSGSGKTTLLKAIAGFEAIDSGAIWLAGRNLAHISPGKRDIGMVFQNYALFPHMTVAENVAFPLKMRRLPREEIARKVAEALKRVDLPDHGDRYPLQLSGGQQQRVALARAVVFGPKLLLLDEPFGALDRKLREGMQEEVRSLQKRLGLTTVFITHDQEEALAMSDRIAVMNGGVLLQVGTPEELYSRPADIFTASFLGESNLLGGRVAEANAESATVDLHVGIRVRVATREAFAAGAGVTLLLRPDAITPGEDRDCGLEMRVTEATYLGTAVRYRLEMPAGGASLPLIMRLNVRDHAARPAVGDLLTVGWRATDGHLLSDPGGA